MRSRAIARLSVALSLGLIGMLASACHEEGSISVHALRFKGNTTFSSAQLKAILATQENGMFPWSPRHYFDRAAFEADGRRIQAYYADRGYDHVRILSTDVQVNQERSTVDLTLTLDEGEPTIVDEVRFDGFESLPADADNALRHGPLTAGSPRDRAQIKTSRDLAVQQFKEHGYALGHVDAAERPSQTTGHVIVTFRGFSGEALAFGEPVITGLEQVEPSVVTRELTFKPGDPYRESRLSRMQRRLSAMELFGVANVTPDLDAVSQGRVPIRVTVAEAPLRQLRFGLGYGSEDRVRTSFNWRHNNFFGGARQALVTAKASYLERGVSMTLTEPHLSTLPFSLEVTATAWRVRQLTYDSQTYGGRVSLSFRSQGRRDASHLLVRYNGKLSYRNEYLRYGVTADALADVGSRAELIALGLNPITGRGSGTLAEIEFDGERGAVDTPANPTKGLVGSVHFGHAAPWLGGVYRFNEVRAEAKAYQPIGRMVLTGRARMGVLSAANPSEVPFSQLYFLGGASSLRGWGRYEVSPLDTEGQPVGGRSLVEMSTEAHFRVNTKLSVVGFLDSGSVGGQDWNLGRLKLFSDVGPGLRYHTPIGVIRADVGFQLNHIPGLAVNGQAERRQWRAHFTIGEAF